MKILIVEDDADSGEALMHLLSDFGHEVRHVMDPVLAPAASLEFRPHFTMVDIGLPVISGYELVGQLRALPELASSTYVSVSAYAGSDVDRKSAQAGFARHFSKPLDFNGLLAYLEAVAPPTQERDSQGAG